MRALLVLCSLFVFALPVAAQSSLEPVGTAYRLADGRIVILTTDGRWLSAPTPPLNAYGYGRPPAPCAPREPLPDTDVEGYAHRRQQRIRESHLPPEMRTPLEGQYGWTCGEASNFEPYGGPAGPRTHPGERSNADLRAEIRAEQEARRSEIARERERIRSERRGGW